MPGWVDSETTPRCPAPSVRTSDHGGVGTSLPGEVARHNVFQTPCTNVRVTPRCRARVRTPAGGIRALSLRSCPELSVPTRGSARAGSACIFGRRIASRPARTKAARAPITVGVTNRSAARWHSALLLGPAIPVPASQTVPGKERSLGEHAPLHHEPSVVVNIYDGHDIHDLHDNSGSTTVSFAVESTIVVRVRTTSRGPLIDAVRISSRCCGLRHRTLSK
jgi:hypothetical protein